MRKVTSAVVVAALLAFTAAFGQSQAPANCLHGSSETAAQASRRQAALQLARKINTTEAQANSQGHTYYVLSDLPGLASEVSGFNVQLSTDGASYIFSMKDTLDACHFAYFSDQTGVIYSGIPIK
jgi:hypothetical protein